MTRIHTRLAVAAIAVIAMLASGTTAQETPTPYDCEKIVVDGLSYDISPFKPT
jgi:hypothetical protein